MMKSILIVIITSIALLLPACNDDNNGPYAIWDIYPLEYGIEVVNADGEDLLDSATEGNILGQTATLVINGVSTDYVLKDSNAAYDDDDEYKEGTETKTRMYLAHYYGVKVQRSIDKNYLMIGEWQGEDTATYEMQLIIAGHTYDIRLTNEYRWKNNKPKIKRTYMLNGEYTEWHTKIVL